jgi:type IV pilus assembly protein PilY1
MFLKTRSAGVSMTNRFLKNWITAGLLAFSLSAGAEDIDLFMVPTPDDADKPNVLIIVDNTANWNQAFANEMAALAETFAALPADQFRIGIMFSAETGSPNNSIAGGYVRAAVRLMSSANKITYKTLITSLDKQKDAGNGGQSSLVMAEAYRYLSGAVPYAGNNKVKTDYTGNTFGKNTPESRAVYALPGNALSAFGGLQYNAPVTGCEKNFIIYISNGAAQDNASVIEQANSMLATAATAETIANATAPIQISPTSSQDNASDEWARFMKKSDLGVTTYTIDVDKVRTGQGPGWSALLQSMADVSNGKYFDVSSAGTGDAIRDAMNSILSEIQAVNSVFAAVSLPVSVNTQGTYLNQVFVGMFRPDGTALPRWAGNLKQYKLGYASTGKLALLDADDNDAISSGGTGFIAECARSFWTPTAVDSYWTFQPQGGCLTVLNSDISNYPDGNIVEKGAQAHKLRSTVARTVKTCSAAACTSLIAFNNTNVSQAALGAATPAERDDLVNWAFGLDVADPDGPDTGIDGDENRNGTTLTEIRPSVHGDVVHSRPVAINFGTDAAPEVVVFYGGNDGMLRAVNGNRDGGLNIGTKGPGMELWSFMAPEFYPYIKRIRDNKTPISYVGMSEFISPPPKPKPYGFDGAVSAHEEGSSTWIYATMRRGGRAFYAFDVTNPASPSLKWRKGCPNNFLTDGTVSDTGCTSGFEDMGQSWSAPKVMKAAGYAAGASGSEKPLLIVGGGYDVCEDRDPAECSSSTKGDKIYVLDANTGALLKTFDTDRAVVADVFVIPDSATGLAKFVYAADLGGNIYRISGANDDEPFASTHPRDWTITKIASLGCDTPDSCTSNRKFMFAPDVVEDNGKYVLMIGSGDREKPLRDYDAATGVSNYFFMVKDDPTDDDWLDSESDNCGEDVICLESLYPVAGSTSPTYATVDEKKGWYLALDEAEQVVTSAITIFGTVTFSTHQPAEVDPEACTSDLGVARVYNINYKNGGKLYGMEDRFQEVEGGGLSPSPVGGMVTLDSGETVPFCIGCNPESALQGGDPPPAPMAFQPKSRVYWHIQQ